MKKKNYLELVLDIGLVAALIGLFFPTTLLLDSFLREYTPFLDSGTTYRLILGNSMFPSINDGDLVLFQKHAEDIKTGDIISFKLDWFPARITHRVIDVQEEPILTFKTKGDNNDKPDIGRITIDQVRGKAILILPTSFLVTPYALYTPIILSAIWISARIVYWLSKRNIKPKFSLDIPTALFLLLLITSCAKVVVVMSSKTLY